MRSYILDIRFTSRTRTRNDINCFSRKVTMYFIFRIEDRESFFFIFVRVIVRALSYRRV